MPGPNVPERDRDDVYRAQAAEVTRKQLEKDAARQRRQQEQQSRGTGGRG